MPQQASESTRMLEPASEEMADAEYNAAFAMPVPYSSTSAALGFYMVGRGSMFRLDDTLADQSAAVLLELAKAPGSWRDAVVGCAEAWDHLKGPLGGYQWNLNEKIPGVLIQSIQHYPERTVKLAPFTKDQVSQDLVACMPGLKHVVLSTEISVDHLEKLAVLPLASVELRMTKFNSKIPPLLAAIGKRFSQLTELRLPLGTQDFSGLAPLAKSLQKLSITEEGDDWTRETFQFLAEFTALRELELTVTNYMTEFFGISLDFIPPMPQLEALCVGKIREEDCEYLKGLQKLRRFETKGKWNVPREVMRTLATLPALEHIAVTPMRGLSGEDLSPLAGTLLSLELKDQPHRSFRGIAPLYKLRELVVPNFAVLEDIWPQLSQWTSLEVITVHEVYEYHYKRVEKVRDEGNITVPPSFKEIRVYRVVDVHWKRLVKLVSLVTVPRPGGVRVRHFETLLEEEKLDPYPDDEQCAK